MQKTETKSGMFCPNYFKHRPPSSCGHPIQMNQPAENFYYYLFAYRTGGVILQLEYKYDTTCMKLSIECNQLKSMINIFQALLSHNIGKSFL